MDNFTVLSNILTKNNISFNDQQIHRLCSFYDMIIEKNKVMNLTSITDFEDACNKHFVDSISLLNHIDLSNKRIIDIGTGAGFPGIPLAIFCENSDFVLIDSLNKRINFIQDVISALNLTNVCAMHARAEELARKDSYREQFDFAVSRAVANLSTLSEFCIPFVKVGGSFISYKGAKAYEEISLLGNAANLLGGSNPDVVKGCIDGTDFERFFVIFTKQFSTPSKFPRGGGKPVNNPLK